MKTICLHVVAATLSVMALCHCQSSSLASGRGGLRLMESKHVTMGEKRFVQRRYLVTEHPLETQVEMVELR